MNGSETFHIAAYQLLEWAKDVAYVNHKEKVKKYEVQEEVELWINTGLQITRYLVRHVILMDSSQC